MIIRLLYVLNLNIKDGKIYIKNGENDQQGKSIDHPKKKKKIF